MGHISKTKFGKWQKGDEECSDWQCSYCNRQTLCLGVDRWNREAWPTDEQVLQNMKDENLDRTIKLDDVDDIMREMEDKKKVD